MRLSRGWKSISLLHQALGHDHAPPLGPLQVVNDNRLVA